MGLDTSHDCWHGAYSAFMRWRQKLCAVAGLPPLQLMDGFFKRGNYEDPFTKLVDSNPEGTAETFYQCLPIKWDALKPSPLHKLLNHSDCDGEIASEDCGPIADCLEALLPLLEGDGGGHIGGYRLKTQQFIDGLRRAAEAGEPVIFH